MFLCQTFLKWCSTTSPPPAATSSSKTVKPSHKWCWWHPADVTVVWQQSSRRHPQQQQKYVPNVHLTDNNRFNWSAVDVGVLDWQHQHQLKHLFFVDYQFIPYQCGILSRKILDFFKYNRILDKDLTLKEVRSTLK